MELPEEEVDVEVVTEDLAVVDCLEFLGMMMGLLEMMVEPYHLAEEVGVALIPGQA